MTTIRFWYPLTLVLLLTATGCSVTPTQPLPPPPVDDRTTQSSAPPSVTSIEPGVTQSERPSATTMTPSPAPQPAPVKQTPALIALLDQAENARDEGNYRSAQGSLQRAQRIAPKDPDVYYALALTHMEMEDYGLAEQVALKGVSVAQGNNRQLKRLWTLVGQIRMRAGNASGSKQAEERAQRY